MGKYDIPDQIDYVISQTGVEKVSVIGHSTGTTAIFTALAEGFGLLGDKVNVFIALAPIANANLQNDPSFASILRDAEKIKNALNNLNLYEIYGPRWGATTGMFCRFFDNICDNYGDFEVTPFVNDYQIYVA